MNAKNEDKVMGVVAKICDLTGHPKPRPAPPPARAGTPMETPRTDRVRIGPDGDFTYWEDFARQLERELSALTSAYSLASEQLMEEQREMRAAMEVLDKAKVPSNGPEGFGKRESLSLSQRVLRLTSANAAMAGECRELREGLEMIASYDKYSEHGEGICPYGCDTPYIAKQTLAKHPAQPPRNEKA